MTDSKLIKNIYKEACHLSYLLNDLSNGDNYFSYYIEKCNNNYEKAQALHFKINVYKLLGKQKESIKIGLKALELLDLKIPSKPNVYHLYNQKLRLKKAIQHKQQLYGNNIDKELSIKILNQIGIAAYNLSYKKLFAYVVMKIVEISEKCGAVKESAIGYLAYGMLISYLKQDYHASYKYGKRAIEINQQYSDVENRGLVYYLFVVFMSSWKDKPLDTIHYLDAALEASIAYADNYSVVNCCSRHLSILRDIPRNLKVSYEYAKKYIKHLDHRGFHDGRSISIFSYYYLEHVIGNSSRENYVLSESVDDEKHYISMMLRSGYNTGLAFLYLSKAQLYLMYNDYTNFSKFIDKSKYYEEGVKGFTYTVEINFLFCLSKFLQSDNLKFQSKIIKQLQLASDYSPQNFKHYLTTIKAKQKYIKGNFHEAFLYYDQSIDSTVVNKIYRYQGIISELAAYDALNSGFKNFAQVYFHKAYEAYYKWGALKKIEQIMQRIISPYKEIFCYDDSISKVLANQKVKVLLELSHNLINEIDYNTASKKILNCLENILSCNIAALVIYDQKKHINSIAYIEDSKFIYSEDLTLDNISSKVSQKAVNYVTNTFNIIESNNDSIPLILENCNHIKQYGTLSLLCTALITRNKCHGVIYVENRDSPDKYSQEDISLFDLLASQSAVAISNIQYLNEIKMSNEDLRQMGDEVAFLTKQVTASDLASSIAHQVSQPLQVISHYSTGCKNLLESNSSEAINKAQNALAVIAEQASQTGDIINSLKSFFNKGKVDKKIENLKSIIKESINLVGHKITASKIIVHGNFNSDDIESISVNVDKVQILHILINLLNNSIEAILESQTAKKEILLTISESQSNQVSIVILDTGPGVESENHLFIKTQSSKKDGMGMGLYFAKIFAENNEGVLKHIYSTTGAAFELTLPIIGDNK